jgi:hypothetical protein
MQQGKKPRLGKDPLSWINNTSLLNKEREDKNISSSKEDIPTPKVKIDIPKESINSNENRVGDSTKKSNLTPRTFKISEQDLLFLGTLKVSSKKSYSTILSEMIELYKRHNNHKA